MHMLYVLDFPADSISLNSAFIPRVMRSTWTPFLGINFIDYVIFFNLYYAIKVISAEKGVNYY